ncbi:MAG TPA: MBL fold metallo-hydrolase [Spirochaetota bacterium]|nr:MBL fold metallo-hydrolase [Spirochaetota bacterium]HNT12344.1 MBL fold metallo-hydrolase [Spirochaetota bacterium]
MKLCDGVYAYVWRGVFENNCNTFYFGEPLNILFDPGLKHHLDLRFADMKKDGLNPDDINYVVNTHCHPDHLEGSEYFMDKGVKVAMHADEIEFLNTAGPQFFAMFGMPFPKYTFDPVLTEGTWEVNGVGLEVYLTPGHSPGSICVYWPEKKALACGDLIFRESVGRVDFPGGSGAKLKESISRMAGLDVEYLLPGHMECVSGARDVQRNFEMIRQYFFSMM